MKMSYAMNVQSFMRLNNLVSAMPEIRSTNVDCGMPYYILCVDDKGIWYPIFISEDVVLVYPEKLEGGVVKGFFDGLVVTEQMDAAGTQVPVLTVGTTDVEELI